MAIEIISATDPTVTAPVEAATYDKWHLTHFQVDSSDPNGKTRLEARFRKGSKDSLTGVWTLAPRSDETVKELKVDDLLALAGQDAGVETVMNGVLSALVALGVEQGLL